MGSGCDVEARGAMLQTVERPKHPSLCCGAALIRRCVSLLTFCWLLQLRPVVVKRLLLRSQPMRDATPDIDLDGGIDGGDGGSGGLGGSGGMGGAGGPGGVGGSGGGGSWCTTCTPRWLPGMSRR